MNLVTPLYNFIVRPFDLHFRLPTPDPTIFPLDLRLHRADKIFAEAVAGADSVRPPGLLRELAVARGLHGGQGGLRPDTDQVRRGCQFGE
jgi:hypothetical protein